MSFNSAKRERLNKLLAAIVDETVDRQVSEGALHTLRLLSGSEDHKLAQHAHKLFSDRVNLRKTTPIELSEPALQMFRDIYLFGSGISTENGQKLKQWLETGDVPQSR